MTAIAQRLGYLNVPGGVQIADSEVGLYPAQDVLVLATGSQGEPMAALSRIAIDDHRYVKVQADDTVVISARSIPGNEKAIGRVINHLSRRGADVIHEGIKHVHVSGLLPLLNQGPKYGSSVKARFGLRQRFWVGMIGLIVHSEHTSRLR